MQRLTEEQKLLTKLCSAGYPIGSGVCAKCGAMPTDQCKLVGKLSLVEIKTNQQAYLAQVQQ